MGKKTGSRSSVNMLFACVRMQSTKVKVFLAITAMISSLAVLKYSVSDYNNFFIASESVHAVGIIALIYKVTNLKTCSGMYIHF